MVKIDDVEDVPVETPGYGHVIERIEIMRSMLRWADTLDRSQIESLINHCSTLRDDVMAMSHSVRFLATAARQGRRQRQRSPRQRREALLERNFAFDGVFGESPALLDAFEIAEKAAPTPLPVLINGESGTGKELLAKVIHASGSRPDAAYVSVNCGAIPESLIESELFGHVKGAFTGATANRAGRFESADGGTIFLDEIGELPLQGQVKLLRVLQSREIQRVGSDATTSVDTRVVAATNRDLKAMCADGRFREDLYYRLSVIQITLPALRERTDEIDLLIEYFANEASEQLDRPPVEFSRALKRFLARYSYPGNIRELRNIIYRLSCLADQTAELQHLPEDIRPASRGASGASAAPAVADNPSLSEVKRAASDDAEREFLQAGLIRTGGAVKQLAEEIGVNRTHLQSLLKKHKLKSKDYRNRQSDAERG